MLSNLLLVLGMCFFFGGINRLEQHFNVVVAQTAASLLALSVGALLIPTAFTWGVGSGSNKDEKISRGTAIIMLLIYASYLIFQLKSHKEIYNAPSPKVEKRKGAKKEEGETKMALAHALAGQAAAIGGAAVQQDLVKPPEEEEEEPQLSMIGSIFTLCASTALVGVCAEFLVDSIKDVTCEYPISQYFVGLILLPIVGNAAEHATAVTVAIKDKMDLAIGVAVGSSMQIALLVLPLMVVLGWILGKDMTLVFDDVSPSFTTPTYRVDERMLISVRSSKSQSSSSRSCSSTTSSPTESRTGWRACCCSRYTSSSPSRRGSTPTPTARTASRANDRPASSPASCRWLALLFHSHGCTVSRRVGCAVLCFLHSYILWHLVCQAVAKIVPSRPPSSHSSPLLSVVSRRVLSCSLYIYTSEHGTVSARILGASSSAPGEWMRVQLSTYLVAL